MRKRRSRKRKDWRIGTTVDRESQPSDKPPCENQQSGGTKAFWMQPPPQEWPTPLEWHLETLTAQHPHKQPLPPVIMPAPSIPYHCRRQPVAPYLPKPTPPTPLRRQMSVANPEQYAPLPTTPPFPSGLPEYLRCMHTVEDARERSIRLAAYALPAIQQHFGADVANWPVGMRETYDVLRNNCSTFFVSNKKAFVLPLLDMPKSIWYYCWGVCGGCTHHLDRVDLHHTGGCRPPRGVFTATPLHMALPMQHPLPPSRAHGPTLSACCAHPPCYPSTPHVRQPAQCPHRQPPCRLLYGCGKQFEH